MTTQLRRATIAGVQLMQLSNLGRLLELLGLGGQPCLGALLRL